MAQKRYDAIVLGIGGIGSATTYQLAERGLDVLGLEQYDIPHSMGSSHGITRLFRLSYFNHPAYVPLLERAFDLWQELETNHDTQLLHVTGSVDAGPPESSVFEGAKRSCERHDLDHAVLTGDELSSRYPGFDLPSEFRAVSQPDGGFLFPEQCIVAHVEQAHEADAEIRAREQVEHWEPSNGGVVVETDRGSYEADTLIVTAGAWAAKQLDVLDGILKPERRTLAWFQPIQPSDFTPDAFPVFHVDTPERTYYGFPRFHVPGIKLGMYSRPADRIDPDTFDRTPLRKDEATLRAFASEYLADGAGPTIGLSTCIITNTPDDHFILDRHPEYPQVVIGAGFSGHGFKLASVLGEILTDLALNQTSRYDTDMFSIDRFQESHP